MEQITEHPTNVSKNNAFGHVLFIGNLNYNQLSLSRIFRRALKKTKKIANRCKRGQKEFIYLFVDFFFNIKKIIVREREQNTKIGVFFVLNFFQIWENNGELLHEGGQNSQCGR